MTYTEWLEERLIETEPVHICEEYMDTQNGREWCEMNCEGEVIRRECLRHIFLDKAREGEDKTLEHKQERQKEFYACPSCLGEVHENYTYCPFCGADMRVTE